LEPAVRKNKNVYLNTATTLGSSMFLLKHSIRFLWCQ